MEPIAIVGMACRFPGAPSLDAYWRLLRDGVDAIREVPPDRWDLAEFYEPGSNQPGKMTTRWGGFLERVDEFDPSFFGISPREAAYMDPQQRLLLEVAWEALEEGGLVAERLAGAPVGVFVGVSTYDYGAIHLSAPERIADGYANTGGALSIVANRLSYLFDFRGPSVALDTACSSSLVATDLACRSLWSGQSEVALVGGVNVILSPTITIAFSRLKAMAADGRCKTFDARADGYVRGEGAAVVVLKPLSAALRDGDRIHALIRGSAVNQDGRTNGLTAPNGLAQEALVREALARAGVDPGRVGYVEAHGTGTRLGDPIELTALGAALAPNRPPGRRCAVGSVKTNIGHLEAAAGIAGLVKVALALEHGEIPPSLHFETPNPHIPFDTLPLEVQRTLGPWPEELRPAIAGVSSFGFGGTNVHVVLEEPPRAKAPEAEATGERAWLLPLSARSSEALRAAAGALAGALDEAGPSLADLAGTAAHRRTHHEHRLGVVARSRQQLKEQLEAFAGGDSPPGVSVGRAVRGRRRKVAFVFPGQGSQWFGMARGLLASERVFRESLEACAEAIRRQVEWSLLEELHADAAQSPLATVDRIQPALWAIQVALAALWRSWGVEPDAVVGHSMGEVAASHVAGALRLDDAAAVICRRSRLLRRTSGQGAMAAVELSLDDAARALAGYEDRVSIAVSNSPSSTVLSGDVAALEEILRGLEARNVFCRRVKVDVASHSPQMDPLRADLLQALADVRPVRPTVPLYSTVTGAISGELPLDAAYWVRNLREPVLFSRAVERLSADKHSVFVEVSPHPLLLAGIQQTLQHLGKEGTVLPSLRREEDEQAVMLGSLGALFAVGRAVDWSAVAPPPGRLASLPAYPWQRDRYWIEDPGGSSRASRRGEHPLLGRHLSSAPEGTHYFEKDLGLEALPYLADHRVQGAVVLPAAAVLEMALAAARAACGPGTHALEGVEFTRALVLPETGAQRVQLVLSPPASGLCSFELYSVGAGGNGHGHPPALHAKGRIRLVDPAPAADAASAAPEAIQARCEEQLSAADHYGMVARQGLQYGPLFQGVEHLWRRDGEALARVRLPEPLQADAAAHSVHPALLDACFQVLAAALPRGAGEDRTGDAYLPVSLERLVAGPSMAAGGAFWGHAVQTATAAGPDSFQGDVFLLDEGGTVVVGARGLRVSRLGERRADASAQRPEDWFYEVRWEAEPAPARPTGNGSPGAWLVFADQRGLADALRARLEAAGGRCALVTPGDAFTTTGPGRYQVRAGEGDDYDRLLADATAAEPGRLAGIVHLWGLDVASAATVRDVECASVVQLVQALARRGGGLPRLWLVSAGAQAVGPAPTGIAVHQAPLWGLGRTLAHEHPELRGTNVDLPAGAGAADAETLHEEIRRDDAEAQVAWRDGRRHVARLARLQPRPAAASARDASGNGVLPVPELPAERNLTVRIDPPGILDNLTVRKAARPRPGPGEVEIAVQAAGLNFLDVLGALGLRPDLTDAPLLGAECAGRITALGAGVEGLAVGDEVVAVAPASFSAFVVTSAHLVARKPAALSFEEAATIPIAFLTAEYALRHLGRLARGERVLIHAAAGGVGLAALQVAQRVGAEVFATAGSDEKRERLRSLGVRHVMDSRSLGFADEVLRATGGQGVDVVLNSLAGEAIPKSLSVLSAYGRFLEIGKRDIYEDRALGLRPFQKNLSFFAVDLNRLVRERPAQAGARLRRLVRAFERGTFTPLPRHVFPLSEVASAFRFMAQARHVGKVVLDVQDVEARRMAAAAAAPALRADGTYLVTGGLGGLGLVVARWMVEHGARHLVLLGRSAPSPAADAALRELKEQGAQVRVARADVADASALAAALAETEPASPPLRGVVHAAGTLDDGIVMQLRPAQLASVMRPKVDGAWNLHEATAGRPLDFFVLFSSAASVLGSPGQAIYAAANAFLDALVHERRARGLPGLSINWGPWSGVGLAARPDRGGRLSAGGIGSLTPAQGQAALASLLQTDTAQVTVMPVDWRALARLSPSLARAPFLAPLVAAEAGAPTEPGAEPPRQTVAALRAAAPAARQGLLEVYLQEQVARVLRLPPAKLDVHRPLSTLGIDSLMAVELKNRVESELRTSLPLIRLVQGPSVAELAGLLLEQMEGSEPPPTRVERPPAPPAGPRDSLLLSILSLGEDERNA